MSMSDETDFPPDSPPWMPEFRGRGILDLADTPPPKMPDWKNFIHGFPKEMFPTPTHVVKYSYKANSSSPLGDDELTAVQGERVEFLDAHPNDAYASAWCRVRNEAGETGYLPSSYLYALDQPITTLPWLESNVPEEKEASVVATSPTVTAKTYVSAYNREAGAGTKEKSEEFYCDVCEREFNGPNPYRAHMSGKAHREQVEIQRYFQSTA